MPRTLFLFATEGEAARFRQLRPDALIEVVGVGMAEAAAGAAEYVARYAPQRVVLAGIAGACGEELRVGECVVVVSDCVAALPEAYRVEYSGREWGNLP
ncbi:MAG: phosphorylase, partial [Alistipes sp.]|nr:phosphorylase [Alistipes sp.]